MGANVAPRGLFGRLTAALEPARGVWAANPQTGVWEPARWVYAWIPTDPADPADPTAGSWEVIWGSVITAPTGATAVYQPASATTLVSWSRTNPAAGSGWIIYRDDGSVAATVPFGDSSWTDTAPIPGTHHYEVAATDGTTPSARVQTGPVDVDPHATGAAAAAASASTIAITWHADPAALPQTWGIYNEQTKTWVTKTIPKTARSFTVASPAHGYANTYSVVGLVAGNPAPTKATANPVGIAAYPPTGVTATATTVVGQLQLAWTPPAGGHTGYEIQGQPGGTGAWQAVTTAAATATSATWNGAAASSKMRIRTTSAGGPSTWVEVGPATPKQDTTPPGAATITSWQPESSYGRLVARGHVAGDTDIASITYYYRKGTSGSWHNAATDTIAHGGTFGKAVVTATSTGTWQVMIRTTDRYGNHSDSAAKSYSVGAKTVTINPTSSATFRGSGWRTDSTGKAPRVLHGRTSSGENFGCYFYGSALRNACVGKTVTAVTMHVARETSTQGSGSAIQPGIQLHKHSSQPAGKPSIHSTQILGPGVGRYGTTTGTATLNSTQRTALASGSWYGICCYRHTTTNGPDNPASFYMRLKSAGESSAGQIRVTTLG